MRTGSGSENLIRRSVAVAVSAATFLSVSGCAGNEISSGIDTFLHGGISGTNAYSSMESSPVIDYAVPEIRSHILTDHEGYSTASGCTAYLYGDEIPETFTLINAETKAAVFESEKVAPITDADGNVIGAEFDLTGDVADGKYLIYCDRYGYSEEFTVSSTAYTDTFAAKEASFLEKVGAGTVSPDDIICVLQAYEWDRDSFADADNDGKPDVLTTVRKYIELTDYESIADDEKLSYATLLVKFGYSDQDFDKDFSTECLQKGSILYAESAKANTGTDEATSVMGAKDFRALTELYRASGRADYLDSIGRYETMLAGDEDYLDDPDYLYGAYTYMTTRRNVGLSFCNILMSDLMEKAQGHNNIKKDLYDAITSEQSEDSILTAAQQIMCANSALDGYEYDKTIKDLTTYLSGCNRLSEDHASDGRPEYILLFAHLARLEKEGKL